MDTKEKIIVTAIDQFMQYGIRSVTMDDIARLSGVSKKTVYQEFVDKNQLVYETFQSALEQDECKMKALPKLNDGVIDHLVGLSSYVRKRFSQMNPFVMNELQRYYPQCWQIFEEFKQKHIHQEIIDVLVKGIEEGYFRPEINPQIIATMRIEQMMSLFDPLKFPPAKFNLGEVHVEVFEHFLHGIFTEKGKETYLKKKSKQE
ncbi:TetR/AcrR family transcriptional regulator [Belliella sp. R4-6]|uniref:TetR/AcrR family transcriptional regulator n=1 Tax=Belliella alkalica TaxID=1730871 RepID=A0ABS9VG11_9BACT|nr:TetR/AcrR family transcriptional regulator [Belliella alkalica]MCH7415376.1 TetR/AcrR family transcriptional regulator [Belliella alkalica]